MLATTEAKKTRLTPRQIDLVRLMRVGPDNRATFASDEVISDWAALKKVMVALGGTWKKGARGDKGGFAFAEDVDASEVIRLAGETGEIFDPNAHDFFPTPAGLADALVARLDLRPGESLLEPSAGQGAIALAAKRACPSLHIVCMEILPANQKALIDLGFTVCHGGDFLAQVPHLDHVAGFDAVAMNPPFGRRADVKHVTHALEFLRPGGRLAAIMSAGVSFRDDRLAKDFRALVDAHEGAIEPNPPGSFRESGTMVNTVTVTMRK